MESERQQPCINRGLQTLCPTHLAVRVIVHLKFPPPPNPARACATRNGCGMLVTGSLFVMLGAVKDTEWIPTGKNSFFRQLDHIVATMANEEFRLLYQLQPHESTIGAYAALKDAIFARLCLLHAFSVFYLMKRAFLPPCHQNVYRCSSC